MGEITSTLGGRIVDSGLAACVITLLTALAMVTTRQPSRRRALARAGVLGALLAIPVVCLRPYEPIRLISFAWLGLRPSLLWIGDRIGTGDPSQWLQTVGRARVVVSYLPFALLVVYLFGVLVGLGRFALGWWGAEWIQRNSSAASPFTNQLYNGLPYIAGRKRPRLRVSSRTRRPVLLGMFRETILIPPHMDRPESANSLRLTLLHELAHAEASDPWFGVATELASIFWFPLPSLWWIRRQMKLDQEYLADRQASMQFGPANRYAASLVDIAATPPSGTQPLSEEGVKSKSASALLPRVLMLLRAPYPIEGHPPAWWKLSLALVTVLVILGATAITLHVARTASTPVVESRSFAMPSVILDDSPMAVSETPLPITLPADFHLTFAVHATPSELSQIAVLGVPLAPPRLVETTFIREERLWHKVVIDRVDHKLALALDNEKPVKFETESLENVLTLRSNTGRRTTFRSLNLTW